MLFCRGVCSGDVGTAAALFCYTPTLSFANMIAVSPRPRVLIIASAALLCVLGFSLLGYQRGVASDWYSIEWTKSKPGPATDVVSSHPNKNAKLHILLPASNAEVNLCKTLLTATALEYPTPTLIAWGEKFDQDYLLGGGSHRAKITRVLEWLEDPATANDDDLILMMDAYDIWFQLRPEVLVSRYHAINDFANKQLAERLGPAVKKEGLSQKIVFGAGKRCAPNQLHSVACYPIPESPLPDDLYGPNTDTPMGRNKYTSFRQRYLNSGYILGPKAEMRAMFRRAEEKQSSADDHWDWDNGSHGSDFMYHGSDQAIFNIMFGEQEYQREVMRRRHLSLDSKDTKPQQLHIEGLPIDDPLNPSFLHEPFNAKDGKPDEFGIGLDYFSDLGMQTVNAEEDSRFLNYAKNIKEQVSNDRHRFDCPSRVTGKLPADVTSGKTPADGVIDSTKELESWKGLSLFTNMCLDRIPVMIHHNGDKGAREYSWENMWIQPHARGVVNATKEGSGSELFNDDKPRGGARTPDGRFMGWDELCPTEYDAEIFRDVDPESS